MREDTQSKRKGYFKEGALISWCLSGLCPLCVKYVIKCRLFYWELTRNWVNSKAAKSEFYSWKKSKRRRMRWKFTISSVKFHVNFFQRCRITRIMRSLKWQNEIWLVESNIQAREKLPNNHVVQWLSMFGLDFGRCFHGTCLNVSCLACALWVKGRNKHVLN